MSRILKPQKVSEVRHHNLPIKIEIMLDRNDLDFFFELAGKKIRAPDVDAVTKLAKEHIDQLAKVEWEPVIDVSHSTNYGHRNYYGRSRELEPYVQGADLDLSFERYERGKFEGTWKLKRKHVLDVEPDSWEMTRRTEQPHAGDWYSGQGTIIPYTEEAWAALHAIIAGVHDLNKKLDALLEDEASATKFLANLGTKLPPMLPAFVPFDASVAPAAERRGRRRRVPKNGEPR